MLRATYLSLVGMVASSLLQKVLDGQSKTIADYLKLADLQKASTVKPLKDMSSLLDVVRPQDEASWSQLPEELPFCRELSLIWLRDSSNAGIRHGGHKVTSRRFPRLLSLDLYHYLSEPISPETMGLFQSVTTLRVHAHIQGLHEIPRVFPNLVSLTLLVRFLPATDLSFLSGLSHLQELEIDGDLLSGDIEFLPQSLRTLTVRGVQHSPLRLPSKLEKLTLEHWRSPDLSILEACASDLKELEITGFSQKLEDVSLLAQMPRLESLVLGGFGITEELLSQLESIRFMSHLTSLRLHTHFGEEVFDALRVFGDNLGRLHRLELQGFRRVVKLQEFLNSVAPMLKTLILFHSNIADRDELDLKNMQTLEHLTVNMDMTPIRNIKLWDETLNKGTGNLLALEASFIFPVTVDGLKHLSRLQDLTLSREVSVESVEDFGGLLGLKTFSYMGITSLAPLAHLRNLVKISLPHTLIPELTLLSHLPNTRVWTDRESGTVADLLALRNL